MRYVIGYVGKPTNDGRVIAALRFPRPFVPIYFDQRHVGAARAFEITDDGEVSCETLYVLPDDARLMMELSDIDFPEEATNDGGVLDLKAFRFSGSLSGLRVLPAADWNWT